MKTIEEQAREAAEEFIKREFGDPCTYGKEDLLELHADTVRFFLAAAKEPEQAYAQLLRQYNATLDALVEKDSPYESHIRELDDEIAELRARVAELEGMVPKWVEEDESFELEALGWLKTYDDKIGNGPRMWLIVPPIPLPEDNQDNKGD